MMYQATTEHLSVSFDFNYILIFTVYKEQNKIPYLPEYVIITFPISTFRKTIQNVSICDYKVISQFSDDLPEIYCVTCG
jgi:hypothetical protein